MTKDEIFDAISYYDQVRMINVLSMDALATFLEKLWNKPCTCHQEKRSEERWRPEQNTEYLYIDITSDDLAVIDSFVWTGDGVDLDHEESGNCFPESARTEVQKRCDEINAIIKKGV